MKITALTASHYDSSLYHAQSIRWIEEYGIVKGLGNLHNRFAYNSAFFCFQALFSFSFLLGKSLHTANGLIAAIFLCYAVCSAKVWKSKRISVSDFMRLGLILDIFMVSGVLSSPNSDLLANGLVLYIMCKWISYQEDKEDKLLPYVELCFLAIWAVSVKLSASVIVFLAIYPAVKLLKNKEWKQIVLYIFIGIGIIVPFIIRNVIISGYLLYPYPELDIFNVDWKMPSYTLLFDRNEILGWARGLRTPFRNNESISVWFPGWYESLGSLKRWWWIGIASGCFMVIKCICKMIYAIWKCSTAQPKLGETLQYGLVVLIMLGCTAGWFLCAPLPRYGGGYLYMVSLFGIGELAVGLLNKIKHLGIEPICFAFVLGLSVNSFYKTEEIHFLRVPDYDRYGCEEVMIDQYSFYVPCAEDRVGYSVFPSTPYRERLDKIELRGNTLKDGFRMKNEYRNKYISTYGQVYSDNVFDT